MIIVAPAALDQLHRHTAGTALEFNSNIQCVRVDNLLFSGENITCYVELQIKEGNRESLVHGRPYISVTSTNGQTELHTKKTCIDVIN